MAIKLGNIDKELPDQYPRILIRVSMSDLDPDKNVKHLFGSWSKRLFHCLFQIRTAQPTKLYLRQAAL
jgi:hypothetical protein